MLNLQKSTERDGAASRSIYLTFDDGPHLQHTPAILDALQEHGARATFFVVGKKLQQQGALDIVARAVAEGHTIGNHTFSHRDLTLCSEKEIRAEIDGTLNELTPLSLNCTLVRPPFGRITQRIADLIIGWGYQIALWDNDPRDWAGDFQPARWVDAAIMAIEEHDARVIVCHDVHESMAKHIRSLIERLSFEGFTFVNWEGNGTGTHSMQPPHRYLPPTL